METMRAARIDHFGGPEVIHIERIQRPEPGLGEVRIRVAAASVNPVDYKIRQGEFPVIGEEQLPLTLGRDIAGIVESVGQGVTHLHRGDRVFAMIGADGGYAEYALVKADYVVRVPVQLDLTHAAAVPLAAHTAWQALFDHGRLQAGEKVLIHGASGGVGHFAVQFAKARGATVFATGSGQALDFIRSLGADQVIDYKKQRFEDVCRDVDLVIDLIGGETQLRSWAVLRTGGRLVSTLTEPDSTSPQAQGKQGKRFMAQPDGAQLREIADLIATGKVRPAVNETFPLAEAAQAQRYLQESHVNGKVVLAIAS